MHAVSFLMAPSVMGGGVGNFGKVSGKFRKVSGKFWVSV